MHVRYIKENTNFDSIIYSHSQFSIERLLQTLTEEQNRSIPIPKPSSEYIFDQPDSPQNILFEQMSEQSPFKGSSFDPNESVLQTVETLDALSIKAATLGKLVERLTHHLYLHPKLSTTFLMFFREFCTPNELLSLLIKRYDVPDLTAERIAQLNYNFSK